MHFGAETCRNLILVTNCTLLSTSVGWSTDHVIRITLFTISTFILHRQFTNNKLLCKEMLIYITSIGTVNPKCSIKWLRPHLQNVSLHNNLVSSASVYEAFAVTHEDPFYPRLTTPHSIILSGNTPALFSVRCSLVTHQRPKGACLDTHWERLNR